MIPALLFLFLLHQPAAIQGENNLPGYGNSDNQNSGLNTQEHPQRKDRILGLINRVCRIQSSGILGVFRYLLTLNRCLKIKADLLLISVAVFEHTDQLTVCRTLYQRNN